MENLTIKSISETTKKVLCNHKLYKDINFFEVPHNKVCLAVIRSIPKLGNVGKGIRDCRFLIPMCFQHHAEQHLIGEL